jgi:hypothetical protein
LDDTKNGHRGDGENKGCKKATLLLMGRGNELKESRKFSEAISHVKELDPNFSETVFIMW